MRSRLALTVTPFLLLAMLPGSVMAAPGNADKARHDAVVAFWTPARMAAAIPRDIAFDAVRGFVPNAPGGNAGKPGGGGGGGDGGEPVAGVTGASWGGGGDILKGEGKVFFVLGAFLYQCSATLASDSRPNHAIVLTAAHCAIDKGRFATNWMFIPAYDSAPTGYGNCATTALGCWTAQALFVHKQFADQKRFNNTAVQNDFAFALLGPGGKSGSEQINSVVGSGFGIGFSGPTVGTDLSAYGYPAGAPYDGDDLTYCRGGVGADPNTNNTTWSMACNMTGGSSGGGWLDGDRVSFGGAKLRSLNSYGYSGVTNMYGPKLNSRTQAVYNAANGSATSNQIVSGG